MPSLTATSLVAVRVPLPWPSWAAAVADGVADVRVRRVVGEGQRDDLLVGDLLLRPSARAGIDDEGDLMRRHCRHGLLLFYCPVNAPGVGAGGVLDGPSTL